MTLALESRRVDRASQIGAPHCNNSDCSRGAQGTASSGRTRGSKMLRGPISRSVSADIQCNVRHGRTFARVLPVTVVPVAVSRASKPTTVDNGPSSCSVLLSPFTGSSWSTLGLVPRSWQRRYGSYRDVFTRSVRQSVRLVAP